MPLKYFICPDNIKIKTKDCLKEGGCRMKSRCATRAYLNMAGSDRKWTGKPSTTQLISGTLQAFLKITKDYAISPDQRAFMIHGTNAHQKLEDIGDEYSFLEEKFEGSETPETGISDVLEIEKGKSILVDYKTSGSFKVAKALGFYVEDEPTGEVFKSGPRKGESKTRKILKRSDDKIDRWEWKYQLNKYRIEFEKRGFKVDELKIQCIVRDGNTYIARSRGVYRNIYYFNIKRLPDIEVLEYFRIKRENLLSALKQGYWKDICTAKENWDGVKCSGYCEVAEFCPFGKYLKKEREDEDMAIKNLSEVRRLPRLGKIRLGIKKVSDGGKEYPAEVDYFILDPQTPSELENKKLIEEYHKLYGDKPKQINIMFPVPDPEVVFPQFYKRYGNSAMLKCKGDGVEATCSSEEYTTGLEKIGKTDMGLPKVKCLGKECPYHKSRECMETATLQVLLYDLPGAGVWQITTGSYNSIVSLNSGLDYVRQMVGRFHMVPLQLLRVETDTQYKDPKTGKTIKGKHFILQINIQVALKKLQEMACIDATKILMELPAPEEDEKDILLQQTLVELPQEVAQEPVEAVFSEEGEQLECITSIQLATLLNGALDIGWTLPTIEATLKKKWGIMDKKLIPVKMYEEIKKYFSEGK